MIQIDLKLWNLLRLHKTKISSVTNNGDHFDNRPAFDGKVWGLFKFPFGNADSNTSSRRRFTDHTATVEVEEEEGRAIWLKFRNSPCIRHLMGTGVPTGSTIDSFSLGALNLVLPDIRGYTYGSACKYKERSARDLQWS